MKRLFVETIERVYDYSTKTEAKRHREKMLNNGWTINIDENDLHYIGVDGSDYSYSITYTKLKEC